MKGAGTGALLVALALAGACGKDDKTTALDIKLTVSGNIDQVRIEQVVVGDTTVPLDSERTFPATPGRLLKSTDDLTIWFADAEGGKTVTVTAVGRLCGKDATAPANTPATTLIKGQSVPTTLSLSSLGTTCADGGAGGGSGAGGAAGTGGATGSAGNGGTTGAGGAAGAAGTSGGTGGSTAGAAGAAGTTGTTGTAGRGGTTGTAG